MRVPNLFKAISLAVFLFLPLSLVAEEKLIMICEPQPERPFPSDLVGPDVFLYVDSNSTSKRILEVQFQNELHRIDLQAISMTEFMGFSNSYTFFFEQENEYYVKMRLSITNFSTDNIGPLYLNCYMNL